MNKKRTTYQQVLHETFIKKITKLKKEKKKTSERYFLVGIEYINNEKICVLVAS